MKTKTTCSRWLKIIFFFFSVQTYRFLFLFAAFFFSFSYRRSFAVCKTHSLVCSLAQCVLYSVYAICVEWGTAATHTQTYRLSNGKYTHHTQTAKKIINRDCLSISLSLSRSSRSSRLGRMYRVSHQRAVHAFSFILNFDARTPPIHPSANKHGSQSALVRRAAQHTQYVDSFHVVFVCVSLAPVFSVLIIFV